MNDNTWDARDEADEFTSELEVRLGVLTSRSSAFEPCELSEQEISDATRLAEQMGRKRRIRRIASQVIWAVALLVLASALVLMAQ